MHNQQYSMTGKLALPEKGSRISLCSAKVVVSSLMKHAVEQRKAQPYFPLSYFL